MFLAACAVPSANVQLAPRFLAEEGVETTAAEPPRREGGIGDSYTILKAGAFMPAGDLEDLDDGYSAEVIFGRELLSFFALEGQVGYLATDGQYGSTQLDLWAVPLFVNARFSLPILFLEPYAGAGIGGMYADYDAGSAFSDSDFVLAYSAFIGVEFGIGSLAVGAEYKYVQSEDTKDDFSIEGGMASLFVSIPF
jgi:opacity protein-like surface antigen